MISREDCFQYAITGPVLRATGVEWDVRKAQPYCGYETYDFEIPTGTVGDVYERYLVRLAEMRQSLRILRQALDQIPEGPIQGGRGGYNFRPSAGDAYGRIESPKGEYGFYLVSDGKPNPYRYHVRAPTFINLTSLADMCVGTKVADAVVILGSIDITLGEVDR